jgi:hypothetical protein
MTGWRRPSDVRATRAHMATAAGVFEAERAAEARLQRALQWGAECARAGRSTRVAACELTAARKAFERALHTKHGLTTWERVALLAPRRAARQSNESAE